MNIGCLLVDPRIQVADWSMRRSGTYLTGKRHVAGIQVVSLVEIRHIGCSLAEARSLLGATYRLHILNVY